MAPMALSDSEGIGYNAVPPPLTGLFAPPSIDLSNSGLEKFKQPEFEGYGVKVNKGVSENVSKEVKKTSDAPIIEDWVFDCDEDETVVLESLNVQKPKQADQLEIFSKTLGTKYKTGDFIITKEVQGKPVCEHVKRDTGKGRKRMTSVVGEQGINAVKPTAYVGHGDLKVVNSPCFTANSWLVQDQTVSSNEALAIQGKRATSKEHQIRGSRQTGRMEETENAEWSMNYESAKDSEVCKITKQMEVQAFVRHSKQLMNTSIRSTCSRKKYPLERNFGKDDQLDSPLTGVNTSGSDENSMKL
ncbi:hypothetical protein Tco_0240718 [Tanacetum coccineum]